MKRNLFFYVFAVLCTMPFFTSCSDDEENAPVVIPIDEEIAGNYGGTLEIQLSGVVISGDGIVQNINVTKAGDNAISLSIVDFSFVGVQVGDINLENCPLVSTGENSYSFTADPFDLASEDGTMTCTVTLNTGTIVNETLILDLSINAQLGTAQQDVTVTFTGERGVTVETASSEAQITSFSFDTSVEANAAVLTQPVIDEENHTITFTVEEGLDITALVPTIEVSEGATVSPASGAAVNFETGSASFTVVAEDGTTSVTYTASCNMSSLIQYDFETWATPADALYSEVVNPEGWATCNDAVALIKNLGSLGGITYTGEYPVRQTTDAYSGSTAAMLESVDTQGGSILGQTIPKVTAGSMFLGTFNAMAAMSDPMATTEFGILYDKKPVKVSGYYKYTPGAEFYNAAGELQADRQDACAISAVLYEVESEDETLNGSTIYTSDKIVAMASFGTGETVAEYTPFELNLEYVKDYDASKTYKFAVIFSASADGAAYNAAVGSTLYIDDVTIENEVVAE